MAWTQAQIDALKSAIAQGATSVSFEGKTVTYRSLSDMIDILRRMEAEVSGADSLSRTTYAGFSRGV
jgi:hypothetical protein